MIDIDKHLGNGIKTKLGDDEIVLPQLGIEYQRDLFKVLNSITKSSKGFDLKKIEKAGDNSPEALEYFNKIMDSFDDDTMASATKLVKAVVNKLFGNANIDEDKKSRFASKYFLQILMATLNDVGQQDHETTKKSDIVAQIKASQSGELQ